MATLERAKIHQSSKAVLPYYSAIFLSAFLLFEVQLLLGKYFLPWFGGTPAVWTTCMFFFQTLLVAGYLYAHLVAVRLTPKSQAKLHLTVLLIALVSVVLSAIAWHCPLMPGSNWRPEGPAHPVWNIVFLLAFSLAGCGALLFLATTNQICQNIAVVPLLWILPLSLYLLSLVICFDKGKWYSRAIFHPALALVLVLAIFLLNGGALSRIVVQITCYSLILFVGCMVCHGELARSKPAPDYLTSFYLMIAVGGAVGGLFVALIGPHLFSFVWEYHLSLGLSALLTYTLST